MSTEVLREAARLMRERANAATWPDEGEMPSLTRYAHGGGRLAIYKGERQLIADFYGDGGDREHYHAMTPTVALAVADWLDLMDDMLTAKLLFDHSAEIQAALAVARAYLGESS